MIKHRLFVLTALLPVALAAADAVEKATVSTAQAVEIRSADPRRCAGFVEAVEEVDIMPRVTGELRKIRFPEGSMVEKGAVLFELEDTTYLAAVNALEARREQLTSQVEFMDKEFRRYQELMNNNAVAASTFDRSRFELNSARAQLKEVEASLIDAKNNLSYTKITAPITGRIGKSSFTVGNLITPGGKKLADIAMQSPIHVRFAISETVLMRDFGGRDGILKNGVISIILADGGEYPEKAGITLADNRINKSTNTITLWAKFKNADLRLIPGGFVTVLLAPPDSGSHAGILPSAVIVDDDGMSAFVVDGQNRAVKRKITIGKTSGKYQVVTSGIKPGETVVVEGSHKLRDGMTVTCVPVK